MFLFSLQRKEWRWKGKHSTEWPNARVGDDVVCLQTTRPTPRGTSSRLLGWSVIIQHASRSKAINARVYIPYLFPLVVFVRSHGNSHAPSTNAPTLDNDRSERVARRASDMDSDSSPQIVVWIRQFSRYFSIHLGARFMSDTNVGAFHFF